MKPRPGDPERALRMIEAEVKILETHDIGYEGYRILREAVTVLRRSLPYRIALALLATWLVVVLTLTGCTTAKEAPATRQAAVLAVTPAPFDCRAYARSLIPWNGPTPSPVFHAAMDADLPADDPKFDARRKAACEVLQADAKQKGILK